MLGRLSASLAITTMATLLLAGCAPGPSEDELLARARAAWSAYQQRMSSLAPHPADATLEAILEVATRGVAEAHLANLQDAADAGVHIEGHRTTTTFRVAKIDRASESLIVDICQDLTQERFIHADGTELDVPDAPDRQSITVTFTQLPNADQYLVSDNHLFEDAERADPCL